jgi:predicted MFS family arabinose efflux permease
VAITAFLLIPFSLVSVLTFSAVMGFLWLATIPPTSGLVAVMFGTRYMALLYGIVFFSHQLGSFSGVWLGGWLYDNTGSYDAVWWIGIALGIAAAVLHWPIRENPVPRAVADRA